MGWFGSGSKSETVTAPTKAAAPDGVVASGELLNTRDLKYALDVAMNLGKPPAERGEDGTFAIFDVPFHCKKVFWDDWLANSGNETFKQFKKSDAFQQTTALIVKSLDMDNDGKLTPKDFQIMYDSGLSGYLKANEKTLDHWLPFAGQIVFGLTVGWGFGRLARTFYKGKFWIAGLGLCGYTSLQYLAQQNFVNKELLEAAFKEKVKSLADINGDGEISREDVNELVANRMQYVATKLGPGGLAPGMTGYASLAVGFLRGVRFI